MGASGAKYGIATSHFYWVGAIPAMVFVGLFMMPFYYGSRARSVPEYLRLRFDEKTRTLNAVSFAVMTVFSSGVSMYAMGKLLNLLLGWSFDVSVHRRGRDRARLHPARRADERDLQRGAAVLPDRVRLRAAGGARAARGRRMGGSRSRLAEVATARGLPAGAYTHTWRTWATRPRNPIGVEWFGLVMGLGFVLSFGYWCTDFLVVQRAMAADSMTAARRTPLIAAVPKMLFPFLVILPGMIALVLGAARRAAAGQGLVPAKLAAGGGAAAGQRRPGGARLRPRDADDAGAALPVGHARARPHRAAGLVHVGDGGQRDRVQHRVDLRHLPEPHPAGAPRTRTTCGWAGSPRWAGSLLAVAAAYVAGAFNNIMDLLQLVFAFVNAPLFATFALGMFWRRTTGHGAFMGLLAGHARRGRAPRAHAAGRRRRRREGRLSRPDAHVSRASWRRRSGPRSSRGSPASSSPSS